MSPDHHTSALVWVVLILAAALAVVSVGIVVGLLIRREPKEKCISRKPCGQPCDDGPVKAVEQLGCRAGCTCQPGPRPGPGCTHTR